MNKHLEPAGSSNGHEWVKATRPLSVLNGMIFCKICGNVKRRDDKNKPCKGSVRLTLR